MSTQSLIKKFLQKEIDPAFARRAKIILANLDIKGGEKILEIGCGRGFYQKAIAVIYPQTLITGIDTSSKYLSVAREAVKEKNVKFLKADARKLPFSDQEFDRVICSEVLEHIKQDELVLQEIFRVLKPSGLVLISVPVANYPFLWDPLNFILERLFHTHVSLKIWWLAGIWADHVRLYTERDLLRKLKRADLKKIQVLRLTHYCFPFSHFLLYGIGKNLVEKGIVGKSFNRFDYSSKSLLFNRILSLPFRSIDRFNTCNTSGKRFVNLVVKAYKK